MDDDIGGLSILFLARVENKRDYKSQVKYAIAERQRFELGFFAEENIQVEVSYIAAVNCIRNGV